ncbi:MFS transporter [Nocardioides sp. zg-579]|uniref:MFS transporter n=1 Tax=Nocardioides marmotae TaxID=2663857 RepID=A0A6I3J0F6_9ACTN|nr:MFS transporter [Nocardioides marmotae]MCR6031328.1 MFS transporter [Gordonia jinghuaiqii]MTB94967.1 MFS transporter [Nocardioides marmotae]QKE02524.1 MFS transporter [Nocardioides marmotae]
MSSRLSPLETPAFRWFFLGEVVNRAGSSMAGVALAFAVLEISDSPGALGLVVAAWTVPMVAFMLLGGALADRLPRAVVLRGCNLVQGVVQAVTAGLVLAGTAEVWHLVVLQLVAGTVFAVSYPAFHGMVPILLPVGERKAAYLLISQSESAVGIAGPALSGLLVATAGSGWALAADAATYVVAAGFLALVRLPPGDRSRARPSVIGDFVAGWSFARGLGWVIPVASASLVFNALISGALGVLGPTIADDTIGSQGWGLARSGQAVGVFVAAFFLARITLKVPLRTCVIGFGFSAVPMVVLGTYVDTWALAGAFVVAGAGLSLIDLSWNLTVQEKVPEEMLSRIMSIDGFFSFVAMPIGQLAIGPLAVALGAGRTELACAVLMVLVVLVAATRPTIARVRLTGGPDVPGAAGAAAS